MRMKVVSTEQTNGLIGKATISVILDLGFGVSNNRSSGGQKSGVKKVWISAGLISRFQTPFIILTDIFSRYHNDIKIVEILSLNKQ